MLHRFINSIRCFSDKDAVIKRYELTLSTQLRARGLEIEVLFASTDIEDHGGRQNRTLFNWKELISGGFPFVKVQVLRDASLNIDTNDLRAIFGQEGYDISLVDSALSKTMPEAQEVIRALKNHTTKVGPLTSVPRFTSPEPPRVAFIGPWNYDNGLGFASRGYVSALWHTGFSVNLHPIRGPFHLTDELHRRSTSKRFPVMQISQLFISIQTLGPACLVRSTVQSCLTRERPWASGSGRPPEFRITGVRCSIALTQFGPPASTALMCLRHRRKFPWTLYSMSLVSAKAFPTSLKRNRCERTWALSETRVSFSIALMVPAIWHAKIQSH